MILGLARVVTWYQGSLQRRPYTTSPQVVGILRLVRMVKPRLVQGGTTMSLQEGGSMTTRSPKDLHVGMVRLVTTLLNQNLGGGWVFVILRLVRKVKPRLVQGGTTMLLQEG